MKTTKQKSLWLGLAAFALLAIAVPAHAQNLDITVSISATKSLAVNTTFYNFAGMSVNTSSVSVSNIDVTNDSGALTETYTLQGANAPSTESGTSWTLSTTPGTDTYALAAQFSSLQPHNQDSDWTSDDLNNATPVTATSAALGNGTAGESGAAVSPLAAGNANLRKLWFRIKTPTPISDGGNHKATLTLAVQ
jgi:hypothetical protein